MTDITHEALEALTNPRQALEEAFKVVFPEPEKYLRACRTPGVSDEHLRQLSSDRLCWSAKSLRFRRFLDAEAWTDAAMMLIGPDRWLEFKGPRKYLNIPTPVPAAWSANIARWNHEGDVTGWGDTLAEAIAQACLKAKEQSDA